MSGSSITALYIKIFGWLVLFTAVELWAAWQGFERAVLVAILLATAFGKAVLIALYFMHLRFESRLVWLLPGLPLFFILFFVCGLFPDIAWRLTGNF